MRIVYLTQSYPPMVSGAAIFAQRLAEGMSARGHHVLVAAASDTGPAYLQQTGDLSVLRLRSYYNPMRVGQRFMLPSRRAVLQALRDFQPDLIHTHDPFQLGLTGLAYARRAGIPVAFSIHQLPWFVASYLPGNLRASAETVLWKYAGWLLKQFSILLSPTQTISDIVATRTGLRPRTISYGLDLSAFSASPLPLDRERILRRQLGLPANVPVILHVGRLDTDKRVDRVIRAAARTMCTTEAHLLIVGDGREKPALIQLARSLGVAERIHFPGFVTVEQGLSEVYRLARLFVTASEIETQGIVLLEAAASGLPITAVRATCIPEIVHVGENGFLAEPEDLDSLSHAMTALIHNNKLAGRMGNASQSLAQIHDQRVTMDLHEELYCGLTARLSDSHHRAAAPYKAPIQPAILPKAASRTPGRPRVVHAVGERK
jgi:glycosyltransferase involved in cell wall biosynthesis